MKRSCLKQETWIQGLPIFWKQWLNFNKGNFFQLQLAFLVAIILPELLCIQHRSKNYDLKRKNTLVFKLLTALHTNSPKGVLNCVYSFIN